MIGGVALLGILGGGYFAYSKGYLAIPFLTPRTDQLFDKMVDSISDIKNAQYSIRLSVKGEPKSSKSTPIFPNKNGNANTNTTTNGNTNAPQSVTSVRLASDTVNANAGSHTNAEKASDSNANSSSNTNSYVIEDVGGNVGLGEADLGDSYLGMLSDIAGFTAYDTLFQNVPGDVDLSGGMTFYLEADEKPSEANGSIRIDGSYTGSDVSVSIDLEARKNNKDFYGIVNKFPSFFFVDASAIKGKWVKITPEDGVDWLSAETFDQLDTQKFIEALKSNLKRSLKEKVFTVKQKLPAEVIGGVKSEHYLIAIDLTKIVNVYDAYINEERAKGKDVTSDENIRDSLKKQESMDALKRIADNSRVEIWVDKVKGLLRQTKWELTVVPPENIEKLKGREFVLGMTLTLEKVNQTVDVDVPNQTIDLDEATRLLTGITKEEQQAQKQISRIGDLQRVLKAYKERIGTFPDSLDQLTTKIRELNDQCKKDAEQRRVNANANTNVNAYSYDIEYSTTNDYNCYLYAEYDKKPVNITDVYTKKPYGYAKDGNDFTVTYNMTLTDSAGLSYYKTIYANGKNTMTSKDVSTEMETSYEKYERESQELEQKEHAVPAVTDEEHPRGPSTATVTLVEYTDFECPFCGTFQSTMEKVMSAYGENVRWVVRQYPLSFHQHAEPAALAAICGRKLGTTEQYWRFVGDLFARARSNNSQITDALITQAAQAVGLNEASFSSCRTSAETKATLQNELNGGTTAGVTGTPTTFVIDANGKYLTTISGALTETSVMMTLDRYAKRSSKDSDADGISDAAEQYVYWTSSSKKDTDDDGYEDKIEVDGGYNPVGSGRASSDQLQRWGKTTPVS